MSPTQKLTTAEINFVTEVRNVFGYANLSSNLLDVLHIAAFETNEPASTEQKEQMLMVSEFIKLLSKLKSPPEEE